MNGRSTDRLPVVDFSAWSIDKDDDTNISAAELHHLAEQLHEAFSTIGFVYLSNHGISQEMIDLVNKVSGQFFNLPGDVKSAYSRGVDTDVHGWTSLERETNNPARPGDLKECFDIAPIFATENQWPNPEVPGFQHSMMQFYSLCYRLSQRVLHLMAVGLGLKDSTYFTRRCNPLTKDCFTILRCLYYPAIPASKVHLLKDQQTRCGEHTDYGLVTLLFQDDVGGLEVCTREGQYVPAVPIPGTVLVNIGDLMQRWTSDTLVSTQHRVLLLDEETKNEIPRRSTVFFVHPDDDELITCIGDTQKYPPILSGEYTKQRFNETYKQS